MVFETVDAVESGLAAEIDHHVLVVDVLVVGESHSTGVDVFEFAFEAQPAAQPP